MLFQSNWVFYVQLMKHNNWRYFTELYQSNFFFFEKCHFSSILTNKTTISFHFAIFCLHTIEGDNLRYSTEQYVTDDILSSKILFFLSKNQFLDLFWRFLSVISQSMIFEDIEQSYMHQTTFNH